MIIPEMSGTEFRAIRLSLGLSQAELGRMLGRTRQLIWDTEGKEIIPPAYALAIRQIEIMAQHEAA